MLPVPLNTCTTCIADTGSTQTLELRKSGLRIRRFFGLARDYERMDFIALATNMTAFRAFSSWLCCRTIPHIVVETNRSSIAVGGSGTTVPWQNKC